METPVFNHLSPILWTNDLNATISFYVDILGFTSKSAFPNFVSLTRQRVELMFIVPELEDERTPKLWMSGDIFIFMKGVDVFWESVKDKVVVKSPISDRKYAMRDFSILDNNGYELVFGEDIGTS